MKDQTARTQALPDLRCPACGARLAYWGPDDWLEYECGAMVKYYKSVRVIERFCPEGLAAYEAGTLNTRIVEDRQCQLSW